MLNVGNVFENKLNKNSNMVVVHRSMYFFFPFSFFLMICLALFLKSLLMEKRITVQDEEPGTSATTAPLFPI